MPKANEEVEEVKTCGHINKQNWTFKPELGYSVLEDLACDMKPGHDGDHSAMKHEVSFRNDGQAWEGNKRVYWRDVAGTPADEIEPDISTLPPRAQEAERTRQKERAMRAAL